MIRVCSLNRFGLIRCGSIRFEFVPVDSIWFGSKLVWFDLVWFDMRCFYVSWVCLIQLDSVWSNVLRYGLIRVESIWFHVAQIGPIQFDGIRFRLIPCGSVRFNLRWLDCMLFECVFVFLIWCVLVWFASGRFEFICFYSLDVIRFMLIQPH